jgi:hypothetical protein
MRKTAKKKKPTADEIAEMAMSGKDIDQNISAPSFRSALYSPANSGITELASGNWRPFDVPKLCPSQVKHFQMVPNETKS